MSIQIEKIYQGFGPYPGTDERPGLRSRGVYRDHLKRLLDITLVLVSLPFVVPVVGLMALAVWISDGHNPFYWNQRVGRGGRTFRMMKLRSMVADADTRLREHLAADPRAAAEWAATQKLKSDPRITRLGCLLRKSSLDELPQLWNVLKGDMSLVGPRPMMPSQRAIYPGSAYYRLRPGLTGPWQVSARNLSTFAARADFDRDYERNLSFVEDARLVLRTFAVVVKGTGY